MVSPNTESCTLASNDPMALHAIYALPDQISEADLRRLLDLPNDSIVSISDPIYMVNEFAQNLVEFCNIGNINGHTFESSRYLHLANTRSFVGK
eukprot:CAMPEP_0172417852 /NCGR_PEP_ID=MMETSP1064-20121228/4343_1 /TAXON_ID=202472 /ORGANISM="Aulacoseira subarctica , Strain CCAP 1002/5" /LENGTH=93 /DNA_ID=CAMNT_0013156389 /DNA_START=158 /DNA_END=436 /DNA_ORIENTATION=-